MMNQAFKDGIVAQHLKAMEPESEYETPHKMRVRDSLANLLTYWEQVKDTGRPEDRAGFKQAFKELQHAIEHAEPLKTK